MESQVLNMYLGKHKDSWVRYIYFKLAFNHVGTIWGPNNLYDLYDFLLPYHSVAFYTIQSRCVVDLVRNYIFVVPIGNNPLSTNQV